MQANNITTALTPFVFQLEMDTSASDICFDSQTNRSDDIKYSNFEVTKKMIDFLMQRTFVNIDVHKMCESLNFKWRVCTDCDGVVGDPFLSMRLKAIVHDSISIWLNETLEVVSSLPGTCPSQSTLIAKEDSKHALKSIAKEIMRGFPSESLESKDISKRVSESCWGLVERAKRVSCGFIVESDAAINRIKNMCVAFLTQGQEAARLHIENLRPEAVLPNSAFAKTMGDVMTLLLDVSSKKPLVMDKGLACLPASGVVQEDSVILWMSMWASFAVECASNLNGVTNNAVQQNRKVDAFFTDVWVDSSTHFTSSALTKQTNQQSLPLPCHMHGLPFPVLIHSKICNQDSNSGLCVARLLSVVVQSLHMGIVSPNLVKGFTLLGLAFRAHSTLFFGEKSATPMSYKTAKIEPKKADSNEPNETKEKIDLQILQRVAASLMADKIKLALITCIHAALFACSAENGSAFVPLKTIVENANHISKFYARYSYSSKTQQIGFYVKKVGERVHEFAAASRLGFSASFQYCQSSNGLAGLRCTYSGKRLLYNFIDHLIRLVNSKGPNEAKFLLKSSKTSGKE